MGELIPGHDFFGLSLWILFVVSLCVLMGSFDFKMNKSMRFLFFMFLFLVAVYGAVCALIGAFNSNPKVLRAKWEMSHSASLQASNELKRRLYFHLCPICGKPSKWYWDGSDWNSKFSWVADLKPEDEMADYEYACEDHIDFLRLLKKGNDNEVRFYLNANYQGPGKSEIIMASSKGPVIDKEEEKQEGVFSYCIGMLIAFIGFGAFLLWALSINENY